MRMSISESRRASQPYRMNSASGIIYYFAPILFIVIDSYHDAPL